MNMDFIFLKSILSQWGGDYVRGMGPGMMNWGYGLGWLGTIISIVFWIAVIVGIIYLIRWLAVSSSNKAKSEESALEILKKKYAQDEISKEEFQEKKKDLVA